MKRGAGLDLPTTLVGVGSKRRGKAPSAKPMVPQGEQWDALLDAISKTLGRCTQPVSAGLPVPTRVLYDTLSWLYSHPGRGRSEADAVSVLCPHVLTATAHQ